MFRKMKWFAAMLLVLGILTGTAPAELIAYWSFDEGQGTTVSDVTGQGNNGTIGGNVEWVPGHQGSAVRLDTAGERIVVGAIDPTARNNAMTLAIWLKWEGKDHATITHQGLFGKRQGWDPRTFVKWFWEAQPDGDIQFRNGDAALTAVGILNTHVNEWIHVAVTWDNGAVVQYVNAEEVNTGTMTFRTTADATVVSIGCVSATNNESFVGTLDEARIFNHALTKAEVQSTMLGEFPLAFSPKPPDGAIHEDTWISVSWKPGTSAVSHDVYFGDKFDDVNSATRQSALFRGNQATTFYVAGFPGYAYPEGLVPGTTYYWRIDEVNDANTKSPWKGDIWRFSIPSRKAYNPSPVDDARFIATDTTLTWTPGLKTKLHYVYFGNDSAVVANATGAPPQAGKTYSPGALAFNKTYYWRVDEFDGTTVHTGDIWSFTTLPEIPVSDPNLVGWWKFDEGTGMKALDWSGHGNHGALQGNSQWAPGQVGGAIAFDGAGDYVDCGNGSSLNITNNITLMCWIKVAAFTKSWETILAKGDDSYRMSRGAEFGDSVHFGCNGPSGGNLNAMAVVTTNSWRHVAMVYDGANKIIYIDGAEDARLASTGSINSSTYNLFISENSQQRGRYLTGLVDDVRIYNRALTLQDIKEAMRGEPDLAWNPNPSNGATPYIANATPLTWSPGDFAAQHDVYFGLDRNAVTDANASDATGVYRGRQNGTSYTPPEGVQWAGGPYYWRIDEFNKDGTISKGRIWAFTVADFRLVDDFESYDATANQIWYSWHDGLGYGVPGTPPYFAGNGTGSAVGDENTTSYTEQTIIHGGRQSMPVTYDNNKQGFAKYSEVELKLPAPQDWTEHGIGELSIWFRGRAGSVGSFVEGPVGTYTMTASGADIWNQADQFHFAYKTLTGIGSIEAQVLSIDNTDPWAKGGVMIRETLDAGSKFAAVYITPGNGCRFQARLDTGIAATSDTAVVTPAQTAAKAPYWVKIERDAAGNFKGYYSNDGTAWTPMTWSPQSIPMGSNVYIGLVLTSHNNNATCTAKFSNVKTTGTTGALWANQDIGIASNAAELLYVAVTNAAGQPAVVVHADPKAAQITTWTEWVIPLQSLQGITLSNADRLAIGLGARGNMTAPGGSGKMYFDDIRLYQPRTAP